MTAVAQAGVVRTPAGRVAAARFAATNAVAEHFFAENADAIARTCHVMADRFQHGGRLFVCGDGAQRSDVAHAVVEFVHPVIVGKRALSALPLPDIRGGAAQHTLATLGRRGDLLMMLCGGTPDAPAREILAAARANGILTVALGGAGSGNDTNADHQFAVPSPDRCIVQETHEMLYHVFWELVHVFFEHRVVSA